jgi:hypothetical protein
MSRRASARGTLCDAMRLRGLPPVLHAANEGSAFLLELVALGVLGWWGATRGTSLALSVLLGAAAPTAAAVAWALFAAPKARIRLPMAGILAIKALVFGSASAALWRSDNPGRLPCSEGSRSSTPRSPLWTGMRTCGPGTTLGTDGTGAGGGRTGRSPALRSPVIDAVDGTHAKNPSVRGGRDRIPPTTDAVHKHIRWKGPA